MGWGKVVTRLLLLGWAGAVGGGCVSVDHLADTLNKRQVTSCIWGSGSYSLFFGVSLVAATGGATIEQCQQLR